MIFRPKMYQKNIFCINYQLLKEKKIKLLIFDLDNTIINPYEKKIGKDIIDLINKLKKDFSIIIASNNTKRVVKKVSDILLCDYLSFVLKPTKKLQKKIMKKYFINNNEICLIGDQLLTDILTGNRSKYYTILVDPISKKDLKITSLNRILEKKIMKKLNINKGEYYEEE